MRAPAPLPPGVAVALPLAALPVLWLAALGSAVAVEAVALLATAPAFVKLPQLSRAPAALCTTRLRLPKKASAPGWVER